MLRNSKRKSYFGKIENWATRFKMEPVVVFVGLLALGLASRAWIDTPNFKPVAAIALFSGFYFRHSIVAMTLIIATLAISDLGLGGYWLPVMLTVYASLCIPAVWGHFIRVTKLKRFAFVSSLLGASLASSLVFFLASNFACWLSTGMYTIDYQGLVNCFAAALPFFRMTLYSDLLFTGGIFGVWLAVQAVANAQRSAVWNRS